MAKNLSYYVYTFIFDYLFENDYYKHNLNNARSFMLAFGRYNNDAVLCCIHMLKKKLCQLFQLPYIESSTSLTYELVAKVLNKKSILNYPFIKKFNDTILHIQFEKINKPTHRKLIYYLSVLNGYVFITKNESWKQQMYHRNCKFPYSFYDEFTCYCYNDQHYCRNSKYGFNNDKSRTLDYLIKRKLWHPNIYDTIEHNDNTRYIINLEKADELGLCTYKGGKIQFTKTINCIKVCDVVY